ncbi:hypothetical protein DSM43518_04148 [Mycobacterium marinum]|nr:hypothetical protein MM1218R_03854 [Mycobacterium marinum]RFZ04641.1 hypothetical protein DE4381_04072 [Mycobacterium marinum]RFZ04944.1 hypothetical protein DSM43518_04148 [Mycobacterium marinum]RFZ50823.1 hypothetical protein MSS4_01896 [Mycobacterium marinum]
MGTIGCAGSIADALTRTIHNILQSSTSSDDFALDSTVMRLRKTRCTPARPRQEALVHLDHRADLTTGTRRFTVAYASRPGDRQLSARGIPQLLHPLQFRGPPGTEPSSSTPRNDWPNVSASTAWQLEPRHGRPRWQDRLVGRPDLAEPTLGPHLRRRDRRLTARSKSSHDDHRPVAMASPPCAARPSAGQGRSLPTARQCPC